MERLVVRGLILLALAALCASTAHAQRPAGPVKRALLIGINTYQPAGTKAQHLAGCAGGRCDLPVFKNLEGPVNDVEAMRDLLSSPKFGFDARNIAVLTTPELPASQLPYGKLAASQSTHDGLLAAMRQYLVALPNKGDTVVFYYAGHGSLRVNSKGTKLAMMVDGKPSHADSTLVPSDAWTGIHDVRDREMTRIFDEALDKGIHLTVLLDSCHSGSFTRGVEMGQFTGRSLGYDPVDVKEGPELLPNGEPKPAPSQRKENPALILSAAQQDQTAKERPFGDAAGGAISHGAFTVALIQALETLPANAPASAVYRQVRATIEGEGVGDQTPSLDASEARLKQPLFGGDASDNGKTRAAAIGADEDGTVLLDAGQLSGIDAGSEFTSLTSDAQGRRIKLRVEALEGLTHARAKVVLPVNAKVAVGQVFELSKWVPRAVDALRFWTWPSNLSQTAVQGAADAIRVAGVTLVDDPVEEPWTDMLAWNGSAWELGHAGQVEKRVLGAKLTGTELRRNLSPDARLWANLPPSAELYAKLALREPNSLVAEAKAMADADYLLAGTLTEDGPGWAWFHKAEYMTGPRAEVTRDHSPGCSTHSKYPVSSDWVMLPDVASVEDTGKVLNRYTGQLAKVNGWLNLSSNLSGASSAAYYKLIFKRVADGSELREDEAAKEEEQLRMYLTSDTRVSEKRWVYVLDIDCHGRGQLLYPTDTSENRFPNDADSPHTDLDLPGAPTLRVGKPYGLDTVMLISTQEPLPDPSTLNFEGVGTRGIVPGGASPLQQLLANTSAGTRGVVPEMPTNWSIESFSLRSIPAKVKAFSEIQ
jgi:hypothetical protein